MTPDELKEFDALDAAIQDLAGKRHAWTYSDRSVTSADLNVAMRGTAGGFGLLG